MKALGLQAYIQPIFIGADMNIIAERVGRPTRRSATTGRPWRIWASGSAAAPTARWSPSNVLDNLRAAVTRQNRAGTRVYLPEQALTVEQAVRLFTSDAAWASRDEGCPRHPGAGQAGRPCGAGPGSV